MKRLLIILILLMLPVSGWGATYYVNANSGSDANSGTSSESPWKTLHKVNSTALSGDDYVYLDGSSTWPEMLLLSYSGTSGHPITVTSYGTGTPNLIFDINKFGIKDSGFEDFTGTKDDGISDNFDDWTVENADENDLCEAVSDSYYGSSAMKLTQTDGAILAKIYLSAFERNTQYTLSMYVKTSTGTSGYITVKETGTTNYYLQDDSSWNAAFNDLEAFQASSSTYTEKHITFTTPDEATVKLRIILYVGANGKNVTYDSIWIGKGSARQTGVTEKHDLYNWSEQVLISGDYIDLKNVNVTGNRLTDLTVGDPCCGIYVTGNNVSIEDSGVNYTDNGTVGISAASSASNVTYTRVTAHDCGNTGLYNSANGAIVQYCTSYSNGTSSSDTGDGGGIASYQGVNVQVLHCTCYQNGKTDTDQDFEISLVDVTGNSKILYNYIYTAYHGGIQICASSQTSGQVGFNIIDGFGTCTANPSNPGKYAGIRVGHSAASTPNASVFNNVVVNGADCADSVDGPGIYFCNANTTGGEIKNNIVANNIEYAVYLDDTLVGFPTLATNCYYNNSGGWHYDGTDYSTIGDWTTASSESSPMTSDPKFLGTTNFHLQAGSPCINAGTNPFSDGDGDQYDYDGNLVWSDTTDGTIGAWSDGVEIGAYGWFGGILLP